MKNFKP